MCNIARAMVGMDPHVIAEAKDCATENDLELCGKPPASLPNNEV